jgi:hypothetical protein
VIFIKRKELNQDQQFSLRKKNRTTIDGSHKKDKTTQHWCVQVLRLYIGELGYQVWYVI